MLPGREVKTKERKKSRLTYLSVYPLITEGWPEIHQTDEEAGVEFWVLIHREWLRGQHPKQKEKRSSNNRGGTKAWVCGAVADASAV